MKIKFLGAAREVTGSCYLLETTRGSLLIDAGLFQGLENHEKNLADLDLNLRQAKALLFTHAHLDHTGRLGALLKNGFAGRVIATEPTLELTKLILDDAAHLASEKNQAFQSIFDRGKIISSLNNAFSVKYNQTFDLDGISITFLDAGHILGSSSIVIKVEGKTLVFSGDIGNPPVPLLNLPQVPQLADFAVIESTYGGRIHESPGLRKKLLAEYIESTLKDQGTVLIPVFAVERTQEILAELNDLTAAGRLPHFPVYLDSPMAIRATRLFTKYRSWFNPATRDKILQGDDPLDFPGLKLINTTVQSKALNLDPTPKLIIAGSGMMTGGRILHHLKHWATKPSTLLLIIGYLVEGTLGRQIYDGTRTIKINGLSVKINARVKAIGAYSAHADQPKLINWLAANQKPFNKVFVVHGEPDQSKALTAKITSQIAAACEIPTLNSVSEF